MKTSDAASASKSKKLKLVAPVAVIVLVVAAGIGVFTFNQQIKQAQGECQTALTHFTQSASKADSLVPKDFSNYAFPASFPAKEVPKKVSADITQAEVQASLKDQLQGIRDLTERNRSCDLKDVDELKSRAKQYSQDEQKLADLTEDAQAQVAKYLAVATDRNQLAEQLSKAVTDAKKTLTSTQHQVADNDTRAKLSAVISDAGQSLKQVDSVKSVAEVQKLNESLSNSRSEVVSAQKAVEKSHSKWEEDEAARNANRVQNQTGGQAVSPGQGQYEPEVGNYAPAPGQGQYAPEGGNYAPAPAPEQQAPAPQPGPAPQPTPQKQSPQIPKGGGWVETTEIEEKCLQGDTKGNSWEVPCD